MFTVSITDDIIAEPLYNFVGLNRDLSDEYEIRSMLEDISIAEFVSRYHFEEFKAFMLHSYEFVVVR